VYTVTVLPEAKPPTGRSNKTRYRYADVGKAGLFPKKRKRRRRK
jgi:hypothetical protein